MSVRTVTIKDNQVCALIRQIYFTPIIRTHKSWREHNYNNEQRARSIRDFFHYYHHHYYYYYYSQVGNWLRFHVHCSDEDGINC